VSSFDEIRREVRRIVNGRIGPRELAIAVVVARQDEGAMAWEHCAFRLSKTAKVALAFGTGISKADVKFWLAIGNAVDTLTDPKNNPLTVRMDNDGTRAT
jgi:hypothetical protein